MTPARSILLIAMLASLSGITSLAEDSTTQTKDYVLYMGLDVGLNQWDEVNPVVDASHAAISVRRGNGTREQHQLRLGGDFKTQALPKVAKSSVTIAGLEAERTYSRGNDPRLKEAAQQMMLISAQQATEEVAARQMRAAQETVDAAAGASINAAADAVRHNLPNLNTGPSAEQMGAAGAASSSFSAALSGPVFTSDALGSGTLDESRVDAYAMSFTIACPEFVRNAYGVARLFVRLRDKPDEVVAALRFFGLPHLTAKPQKISLLFENLPPGFQVENSQIHIYSAGRELATNRSRNRVELTKAEMHQFLMLQHISTHSGGNAPVEIATQVLDNDLRAHVPSEQFNRVVEVRIAADGSILDLKLEPVSSSGPDTYILGVLRQTPFVPAIVRGKPVEGNARFLLSEFFPPASNS